VPVIRETQEEEEVPPTVLKWRKALVLAESKLAKTRAGFEFELDLTDKLGMGINPDLQVNKTIEGGQADLAGVSAGCQLYEAGGDTIATLQQLKAKLAWAKERGAVTIACRYRDVRRETQAAAEVGKVRATLADAEHKAALAAANAAYRQAKEQKSAAEALEAANKAAREEAEKAAALRAKQVERDRRRAQREAEAWALAAELERHKAEEEANALAVELELKRQKAEEEKAAAREAAEQARKQAEAEARLREERQAATVADAKRLAWLSKAAKAKSEAERRGNTSLTVCLIAGRGLRPTGRHGGVADVYALAELIDLASMTPLDNPPHRHRTLTYKRSLDPEWMETVQWEDAPLGPSVLAVRVKLLDLDDTGVVEESFLLGQVVLPLSDAGPDRRGLDGDKWYDLMYGPKMEKAPMGQVQLRVRFSEAKHFDCQVCGRHNAKMQNNVCRICGASLGRVPNPAIKEDTGASAATKQAWLARRRAGYHIPRKPLVPEVDEDGTSYSPTEASSVASGSRRSMPASGMGATAMGRTRPGF